MPQSLLQSRFLNDFACLGDQCEDTCCKGWGMQLSQQTVDLYKEKAPELLEAVTSGEAEHIMKRDPQTDYCVKFDAGWCGIHRDYGSDFLGDACHFFPRVTRGLGEQALMTASLSCPEIVRLALLKGDAETALTQAETERTPHSLRDYKPDELSEDQALAVHRACIEMVGEGTATVERLLARLRSVAASLQSVDVASWAIAIGFYANNVESRLPVSEGHPADPFNLLNALQGLIGASRVTQRPRLDETVQAIEKALRVTLDWDALSIQTSADSVSAWGALQERWDKEWGAHFQPLLKRWLQVQLSVSLFPFAGFGESLVDRVTILGVRFATLKLALMAACDQANGVPAEQEVVRIVQSLARFLDHLADPALSMQIYTETGWVREARLRAVVGDY